MSRQTAVTPPLYLSRPGHATGAISVGDRYDDLFWNTVHEIHDLTGQEHGPLGMNRVPGGGHVQRPAVVGVAPFPQTDGAGVEVFWFVVVVLRRDHQQLGIGLVPPHEGLRRIPVREHQLLMCDPPVPWQVILAEIFARRPFAMLDRRVLARPVVPEPFACPGKLRSLLKRITRVEITALTLVVFITDHVECRPQTDPALSVIREDVAQPAALCTGAVFAACGEGWPDRCRGPRHHVLHPRIGIAFHIPPRQPQSEVATEAAADDAHGPVARAGLSLV